GPRLNSRASASRTLANPASKKYASRSNIPTIGGAYMIRAKKWWLGVVCLITLFAATVTAQDRTIVISGTVVTPEKILNKGWVVIKQKKISAVSDTLPNEENAIWVDTNDIIFPGFVDLHNHPMYAMFEPWDAKQLFNNRYEWRSIEKYKQEISTPARNIQDDPQGFCDIAEFAEVQAVTGGTTTFSGMFIPRSFGTTFPACLSRLAVRKLEIDSGFYPRHGHERVQNVLGVTVRDLNEANADA